MIKKRRESRKKSKEEKNMKKLENKCGCTQTFILNNKKKQKEFWF